VRETILEILKTVKPGVDFDTETAIIDKGLLESFDIIRLVTILGDEFDVEFTAAELIPENFNSVDAIERIVRALED
jgi:acyl carrier protein